jgi:hypothetical protein
MDFMVSIRFYHRNYITTANIPVGGVDLAAQLLTGQAGLPAHGLQMLHGPPGLAASHP